MIKIIEAAKALEITLTNAELETEICQAWANRVELAVSLFAKGDMKGCQAAIGEANRYAI